MTRARLRANQILDADVLTEAEHASLVHQNLTTSGTLNFQDGTISGTGDVYATTYYGDGSNLSGISSSANPESLYYSESPKITAIANGVNIPDGSETGTDIIYNSSNVYFKNTVSGGFIILEAKDPNGVNRTLISADPWNGVALNYYNVQAMKTKSGGIHFGVNGTLISTTSKVYIENYQQGTPIELWARNSSNQDKLLFKGSPNGVVALYYAGDPSFETGTYGPGVRGLPASGLSILYLNDAAGLEKVSLRSDGGTNDFRVIINGATQHNAIYCHAGGATELFHNNAEKFETVSDGARITNSSDYMYFGDPTVSGSWRMGISGEDFIHQKYNGSTWETKQTIVG